jgi:hypothetical protein
MNRLGTSSHTHMHFNLQDLIQSHDLQGIATPFTKKDIDDTIKNMPSDKALGPDGFNGKFLKCWHIIKEDVYAVCLDFFNGTVNIEAINNSFITLIPKVNNLACVNDFRPISLINCVVKIITKLLGDRLQSVIIPLVHKNQYRFIKSRTIQDCLAWAFEYIYQCQHSKREIVIIKLDFTKAFDTIEHSVILQMMQSYGFHDNWLDWTARILNSVATLVLLNGTPGKNISCRRGVRQGDPMSPLLFVLAAELLQCIVNKACQQHLLQMPFPSRDGYGFPIIRYADDTEGFTERVDVLEGNFRDLCPIYMAQGELC